MFADIIKAKEGSNLLPDTIDALDRMQNASLRMSELIQGLLKYSRVSTVDAVSEIVDVNENIKAVISDLEASLAETGGIVNVGDMPQIAADPLQIRQLFQNLIGNALKFHKPGVPPIVDITAEVFPLDSAGGGRFCEITVKDNGIGFPEKDTERIFGVFQKLHKPSEYAGTGIGLSICRKIAERNNGHLTAISNNGDGAEFRIVLPLKG
jgi:signal transduction histidine kinase